MTLQPNESKNKQFRLLLSPREAAQALSVCEKTLWTMTKNGELPAIRVGKRGVRYSVTELERWISKQVEKSA